MGMAVGIDFSWIFVDFDKQVGGKLEARCNKKLIKNPTKKASQKMIGKKGVLEGSGRDFSLYERRRGLPKPPQKVGFIGMRRLEPYWLYLEALWGR